MLFDNFGITKITLSISLFFPKNYEKIDVKNLSWNSLLSNNKKPYKIPLTHQDFVGTQFYKNNILHPNSF